jgi:NADH-quinone oxidoreductase subunit N
MLAQVQTIDAPEVVWSALLPLLILLVGAFVYEVVGAIAPKRAGSPRDQLVTLAIATASLVSWVLLWSRVRDDGPIRTVAGAVVIDGITVMLSVVLCVAVILGTLLARSYLDREEIRGSEAYVLLLLSAAGGMVMVAADDLLVLFLGLEILSIAVYVLTGIHGRRRRSGEAALKYFVLGAFSSAFFLYGIAMIYGATGTTSLTGARLFLEANLLTNSVMLMAGIALLLVGFGFKISAVPFHAWTPDVYEGAPSPVVAFMAAAVKVATFAAMIRVFVVALGSYRDDWQPMLYALAVATLVVGAVLAVSQTNVKRMLAYSSIGHAGFILIGIQAGTDLGTRAVLFYLATYAVTVAGSFAIVSVLGRTGDGAHELDDYRGLAKRAPLMAFAFLVLLLAQLGMPLTSGFLAKFGVIWAAVDARSWPLAIVAMVSSVVAAFVYLRIVLAMYDADAPAEAPRILVPIGARVAVLAAVVATLGLGMWPAPLNQAAKTAVAVSAPALAEAPVPVAQP